MSARSPWTIWRLVALGLVTGVFSGLFGVGGGILMVPALLLLLGMERKRAAGTSLAAIVPMSAVGVISYSIGGNVDLLAAGLLAVGSVVGAQIGSMLLHRLPTGFIRWAFIAFLAFVIVDLLLHVPSRAADLQVDWVAGLGLVALGLVTGVLAGILGVGGGVIVVPSLMLLFGSSDLVAKGTSLAMMIPTAVSGTIANLRRRNIDLLAGLTIGLTASVTAPAGALFAAWLPPQVANWVFAAFIVAILARLVADEVKRIRGSGD